MALRHAEITFSPYGLNFGNVPESVSIGPVPILITCTPDSNENFPLTIASQDPRFVVTPSGDFSLAPGQSMTVEVTLNTTTVLGAISAQFQHITGQGYPAGSPPLLQATVVAGGVPTWSLTPAVENFGNIKIGSSSAPQTLTIKNGASALTINNIALDAGTEFTLGGVPSLPFTIAANGTQTFTVTCNSEFRGLNDYNPGVTVTPSVGPTQSTELIYTGFVLTPAYTLTGNTQGVLFGLVGVWNGSYTNIVAQCQTSVLCEAQALWSKMHDFNNPSAITYANRLYVRTEAFGVVTATLNSTGVISGEVTTSTDIKTRDASTDSTGVPTQMVFDVETNGEIHLLQMIIAAGAGVMVIDEYTPCYETRGPVYESK